MAFNHRAELFTQLSLAGKLLLFSALVILLVTSKFVYNLYLHPLSKFPGPAYLAFSDAPLAYLQLKGTSQYTIRKAHEKYGSVVRVAPRTLSYTSPSAWNDAYGYRNGRAALPKDPQFYNEMLLPDITITRVSDEGAGPIRRALNSAFQPKALQQQEPMILSHIQRLLAQLRRETSSGNAVDIRKWIIFSLFDINSDFVFDEDLGCVEAGKFHEWVEFVTEFFFASTLLHQCYKFAPLQKLLALCIPRSTKERQVKHDEASLMRVRRRMAKQTDKLDFTHHFVKNAEKEGLSLPTIEAQFSVVILAGSESTAVAVNGAIFSVLSNAAVYEKLKKEIRETFETAEDIQLQTIQRKLPYLDAVVQETLRMHPPFANGFTRVVPPGQGGAMISGQWVPPDTVVWINQYCINTATQNFTDPFAFAPERWLGDKKYESDNRDAMQPFSVGPRNCPGKLFGLNNIKLFLTHLIWNFDMELDGSTKDWMVGQKVYNGWIQPDLPVYLHERES